MNIEKIVLKKNELEKELKEAKETIKDLQDEIMNKQKALNKWEERWKNVKDAVMGVQIHNHIPFTRKRSPTKRWRI